MKTNMGTIDRLIRIVLAIIIGALYYTNTLTGTLGLVLVVLAIIFVATSLIGFCPLYLPFGLSTLRKKIGKTP